MSVFNQDSWRCCRVWTELQRSLSCKESRSFCPSGPGPAVSWPTQGRCCVLPSRGPACFLCLGSPPSLSVSPTAVMRLSWLGPAPSLPVCTVLRDFFVALIKVPGPAHYFPPVYERHWIQDRSPASGLPVGCLAYLACHCVREDLKIRTK